MSCWPILCFTVLTVIILFCYTAYTRRIISGTQKSAQAPLPVANSMANGPTTPLSMAVLDSLTVHSKMSLIHSIVTHVIKLAQSKSHMALAPALVETYSRLLVYTEIESLGIKGFISEFTWKNNLKAATATILGSSMTS